MIYFLDTEFIEDGRTIDLLSIGVVSEDGRELYCESQEADISKASDWVKANVVSKLWHLQPEKREYNAWIRDGGSGGFEKRKEIRRQVESFCNPEKYGKPVFWAYYGDYDWVAFCQLFGTMTDLPKYYPMYCRDLKQCLDDIGNPDHGKQFPHHALEDAKIEYEIYRTFVKKL